MHSKECFVSLTRQQYTGNCLFDYFSDTIYIFANIYGNINTEKYSNLVKHFN